jgi:serine/threonine-protein kinase
MGDEKPTQKATVIEGARRASPPLNTDPRVGQTLAGRYRILKKLGAGGMGAVYLGEHIVLEKKFAIKILTTERSREYLSRFAQEAKAASKIGHENIIDITDFGETDDGAAFLAMEFLDGGDLGRRIRDFGPQTIPMCVSVLNQVCSALEAAHEKGIIHRDLKPDNIYLVERPGRDPQVKVLDFGLARVTSVPAGQRLTKEGTLLGTPEYMSPEQVRADPVDGRTDVYSAGCVLYEMLTGSVPFDADPYIRILAMQVKEPPMPPSQRRPEAGITPALEAVVLKALAKDVETRFQSMRDLALALCAATNTDPRQFWHGHERIPATMVAPSSKRAAAQRRWPWLVGAAVVAVGIGAFIGRREAPPASPSVAAPAPVVVVAPAPVAVAAPAATAHSHVKIDSLPGGADVKRGDALLGRTPLELELPADAPPFDVVVSRHGFHDATLQIAPDRGRDYEVPLLPGAGDGAAQSRSSSASQNKSPSASQNRSSSASQSKSSSASQNKSPSASPSKSPGTAQNKSSSAAPNKSPATAKSPNKSSELKDVFSDE